MNFRTSALMVVASLLAFAGWYFLPRQASFDAPRGILESEATAAQDAVKAYDWPQWRGPERTGISKETGLLKEWPKDGPKLLWTYKDAGLGFSGPAIVGDTLYTLGTRGDKEEVVLALDALTGAEKWVAPIGPIFTFEGNVWGDGPRSTPTVDGKSLYVLGGQGDLVCMDRMAKGKEIWRKNMIKDLGGEMMPRSTYNWGYSESPLVDGDVLVCTPGADQGTLAALDKKTGAVKWRSVELKNKAPYSSIVAAEIQGVKQYIQDSYGADGGFTSGVAAADGKVLWTMRMFKGDSFAICPTPIVVQNRVYVSAGYGGGCHLFEIGKNMKAKDLYDKSAQKSMKNTHGGVVLIDGYLYGHSESNRNSWMCQKFDTGEEAWSDNSSLECKSGAITAADGMLYLLSEDGTAALIEASPAGYKEHGRFEPPQKSKYYKTRPSSRSSRVWTHPVIANSRLYLRDHEFVFCYDVRGK